MCVCVLFLRVRVRVRVRSVCVCSVCVPVLHFGGVLRVIKDPRNAFCAPRLPSLNSSHPFTHSPRLLLPLPCAALLCPALPWPAPAAAAAAGAVRGQPAAVRGAADGLPRAHLAADG